MSENLREACRYCRRPLATKQDVEASADTPGLCWSIVDYCETDADDAIDAHLATIARLERELEQARQDAKQSDLDAIRALDRARMARAELARIKAILADPLAVHLNMMRGIIQWTPANLRHLLGDCQPTPADD